jgi:hypothetical protein
MSKRPREKENCGGCRIANPIRGMTKPFRIDITFEEALKLKVAIDTAIHQLNRYDRRTKPGREALMRLSVMGDDRTSVWVW